MIGAAETHAGPRLTTLEIGVSTIGGERKCPKLRSMS
jgi:hypothetical protein